MVYTAGAAAQAAAEARQREEEEDMTSYTREELDDNWEFKIVRANGPGFRKPENLQRLLEEEARAGWVMVEKFDDSRVRFKRPASARSRDSLLPPDVDPYRSMIGISQQKVVWIILLVTLVFTVLSALLVFAIAFAARGG